jgi:hypothetical protein
MYLISKKQGGTMKKLSVLVLMLVVVIGQLCADVFITELADPNNADGARYVELYNNGASDVDLSTGWQLQRATNGNTYWQSAVNLSGTISAGGFYLVCANQTVFTSTFGFAADQSIGTGGPADSNGDDQIRLLSPGEVVIDMFGVLGEDGSGTNHEFEDGRAERKASVATGVAVYNFSEWNIWNDTGAAGTTNSPQTAPDDFDPGSWIGVSGGGPTPVSITNTYAISATALEVFFNQDITAIDPSDFALSGSQDVTFTTATIDPVNAKLVHFTGATPAMVGDATLDTFGDANSDYDFYAGITPIACTNALNPGGTIDGTHFATFSARVSANDAYNNVWISDDAGAYNGVMVYDNDFDSSVNVGDDIILVAKRATYNGLSELVNPNLISAVNTGNMPYGPTAISGADIAETLLVDTNPGESWEGQLVKIENVYIESYTDYDYRCTADGGATYFHVGDNVDFHFGSGFTLTVGVTYQELIGVVDWYNSGPYYRINPRNSDDSALPVTLTSFTATPVNSESVSISWTTESESGMQCYNLYRNEGNGLEWITSQNAVNVTTTTIYSFEDTEVEVGATYDYVLEGVEVDGTSAILGTVSATIEEQAAPQLPQATLLSGNFPNPFNPATTISFVVKEAETATLTIYDMKGRTISAEKYEAGEHAISWDATEYGSGVYFYKLASPSCHEVKKMIMLK